MKGAKKEASPGFLAAKPDVKKTNKKVLGLIGCAVGALLVVLMLTMTSSNDSQMEEASSPVVVIAETENKPLAPPMEGFGLVTPAEPAKIETQTEALPEPLVTVVGPPEVDMEAESARREAEEIRRRKFEREQLAYSAAILVRRGGETGGATASAPATEDKVGSIDPASLTTGGPTNPDGYDPAADRDKENFFVRADDAQWLSPHTREAGRQFEIKTGSVLPGVMISGINSDLPGNLIAQVSQNVFDTATGRHLLIPQGSKLFGVYDSRVVYGQERVLIAWNRVVFPDGSSMTLGAMPGTDLAGYAGFTDQIDNHYLRIFGSAILMSAVTGGMSYAMDSVDNNSSSDDDSTSLQDEMAAALAAQIGQTSMRMLEKNLNIKPTLEIRPGYEFNIVVVKDLVFRGAY